MNWVSLIMIFKISRSFVDNFASDFPGSIYREEAFLLGGYNKFSNE
jgi:hypothetical protein